MTKISPSMIESMFRELRRNGYTNEQILALSAGLDDMARSRYPANDQDTFDAVRYQRGLDELEALCSAGLPHQT